MVIEQLPEEAPVSQRQSATDVRQEPPMITIPRPGYVLRIPRDPALLVQALTPAVEVLSEGVGP